MERLKAFLRRWPGAYARLHKTYYQTLFATEKWFFGTRLQELAWRRKPGGSYDEFLRTAAHPHRPYLVGHIAEWAPFESVLEIGCNTGQNLRMLARRFPDVRMAGIDINRNFIDAGTRWLTHEGVTNVSLSVGAADDLARFPSQSIDLTFTDATLMYVGPDKIRHTLTEIVRITRKAVVLNEWCLSEVGADGPSVWYYFHWVHAFRSLLGEIAPGREISIQRVPAHLWGPDGWREFGTLVTVNLSRRPMSPPGPTRPHAG